MRLPPGRLALTRRLRSCFGPRLRSAAAAAALVATATIPAVGCGGATGPAAPAASGVRAYVAAL
jgi:hypothetical protein